MKIDEDLIKRLILIVIGLIFLVAIAVSLNSIREEKIQVKEKTLKHWDTVAEICLKIEDIISRNLCYIDVAEKSNNSKFCRMMNFSEVKDYGDNQNYCFKNVAIATSNESICEEIKPDPDSSFPENIKNNCYAEIAKSKGDVNVCFKISVIPRDWERNECINDVAEKILDVEGCQLITISWLRDSCYSYIAERTK